MNRLITGFKIGFIAQLIISLCLLSLPLSESFARPGCCSRHGGVAGCNAASGHLQCKDGTTSPSCACDGTRARPVKPAQPTTVTRPAKAPKTAPAQTTAPAATTAPVAGKGCCARHGGVAQCNKSTGYFMCKDGSQSASCKCS